MMNETIRDTPPLGEKEGAAFVDMVNSEAAKAEKEWEKNAVQIALESTLALLHDRRNEIELLFDENKIKVALNLAEVILCSEIDEAVKGKMIVPEYSQKGAAKQTIYVYIGTHWQTCLIQIYYDYVKAACKKIGLSEIYVQDPNFMNRIFERVAFEVSQHISTAQPDDSVWINLKNCTVEIAHDGCVKTHEHRAEDFFLYCLPYNYDPFATCPKWLAFLDEVLPEKEAQTLLGEYIGYCFTQNLKLEKMAVFYGGGANGKSVCLDVIKGLVGRSNVSEATLSSVTNDPEARSLLENKLVNISSESGKNLNSAILKMLVSGEPVEVRKLYVGTKLLLNPPKLITAYNELPPIENTHGYRRRWLLFPFNVTIADNRQDPNLANKLSSELTGVLNWVLEKLRQLIINVNSMGGDDFTVSKICNDALTNYFKGANTGTLFFEECCKLDDSSNLKLKELYAKYQSYCKVTGISKPLILKNFKKSMIDSGVTMTVHHDNIYVNVYVDTSVYL